MQNLNIPEGYQTVMPYIIVKDATGFLNFMQKIFGAAEKMKHMRDDNLIQHAEVKIGDSTIMFADSIEQWEPLTAGLYIHVPNADETYKAALNEGAVSIMEPSDRPYGRSGGFKDPFGNVWWVTSAL
jgi:PhnB protein